MMKAFSAAIRAIACLAAFYVAMSPAHADEWPTTEFEIRWYSSGIADNFAELAEIIANGGLSDDEELRRSLWDAFMRRSLSEIAEFYESEGLKAPNIEIETDNEYYPLSTQ